ncbi:hypothetical protein GN155_003060 [Alcanivorax sp. ZXX171]|nr:hypothetical protein [Alcanivorax sp. ZXX171]
MSLPVFPRTPLALAVGAAVLSTPAGAASLLDDASPMVELYAPSEAISINGFDVAGLPDGLFALVWSEYDSDTRLYHVRLARFDADGNAEGDVLELVSGSPSSSGGPNNPVVAADNDGDLVVAWDFNDGGCGTLGYTRVDADDTIASPRSLSHDAGSGSDCQVRVTMDDDGRYAFGWRHESPGNPPVYVAQTFNADGSTIAASFEVAPVLAILPGLALALQDDTLAVAWTADVGPDYPVMARRYNQNGTALGSTNFRLDNGAPDHTVIQTSPVLVQDPAGGFLGMWHQTRNLNGEFVDSQHGQRWAADGTARAGLVVGDDNMGGSGVSDLGGNAYAPSVATNGRGLILAGWTASLDYADGFSRVTAFRNGQRLGDDAVTVGSYTQGDYFYSPNTEVVLSGRTATAVWYEQNADLEYSIRARSLTLPEAASNPAAGGGGGGGGANFLGMFGLMLLMAGRRTRR